MKRHLHARFALAVLGLVLAGTAAAQGFPDKPVRFVVPFAPGGSVDVLARTLARQVTGPLGQTVVVENYPGASTNRASDLVARARPDGYTLLVASDSLAINPSLFANLGFDPVRSFAPVTLAITAPQILVTRPGSGFATAAGYVERVRAEPGAVAVGLPGNGVIGHLASELLNQRQGGLKVNHIPYNGGAPAATDLLGGHLHALFITLPAVTGYLREGTLVPLAVTSPGRSPAFPAVPTVAEALVPGFAMDSWQGFLAPAETPPAIVDRLNREIVAALRDPAVDRSLRELGFVPVGSTPRAFAETIAADVERFAAIVRSAGIRLE